mgnify:CR=1 FL=1
MPKPDQRLRHSLDERGRAADVSAWPFSRARPDLRQHFGIDAAGVTGPPRRLPVRQGVHNPESSPFSWSSSLR